MITFKSKFLEEDRLESEAFDAYCHMNAISPVQMIA